MIMHESDPTADYRRGFERGATWTASLRSDTLLDELEQARVLLAEATNRGALLAARVAELERGIAERDHAIRGAADRAANMPEACVICERLSRVGTSLVCARCR